MLHCCRGVLRWNKQNSQYAEAAAAKALLPRTQDFQHLTPQTLLQHIPIWVISLARATKRRTTMAQTMAAANVTSYELIDAVDYWNASSITQVDLDRCGCRRTCCAECAEQMVFHQAAPCPARASL